MAKHVYFVRHGESEENTTHMYLGKTAALTEGGKKQAAAVADRIQTIGVDALITSKFDRAKDTAAAIAAKTSLVAEENELLGEWLEPSNLMGVHLQDPRRQEARASIREDDDPSYRHLDEETFSELFARAESALHMLEEHPAERICAVTHGGFLRVMVGAMVFGREFTKRRFYDTRDHFLTTNTGVTYAYYNPEKYGWQLITWNDQAHLG